MENADKSKFEKKLREIISRKSYENTVLTEILKKLQNKAPDNDIYQINKKS